MRVSTPLFFPFKKSEWTRYREVLLYSLCHYRFGKELYCRIRNQHDCLAGIDHAVLSSIHSMHPKIVQHLLDKPEPAAWVPWPTFCIVCQQDNTFFWQEFKYLGLLVVSSSFCCSFLRVPLSVSQLLWLYQGLRWMPRC